MNSMAGLNRVPGSSRVSPSSASSIVRIDTSAVSSGTKAMTEPNTQARMTSAASEPMSDLGQHAAAAGAAAGAELLDTGDRGRRAGQAALARPRPERPSLSGPPRRRPTAPGRPGPRWRAPRRG